MPRRTSRPALTTTQTATPAPTAPAPSAPAPSAPATATATAPAPPRRVLLLILLFSAPFMGLSLSAETWSFTAQSVTSVQRDDESRTVLEGRARVESDTMEIQAESLELLGPDYDIISGSGQVVLVETEKGITIESARFDYDRKKELIRFRGRVSLVDEEEGILIRAEALDFFEKEDYVVMTAAVRLIKEKTIGRGEFATFRRDEKILELSGRPVVWREGDEYRADRITVNLETDEIVLEGAVEGMLITEGESEGENEDETEGENKNKTENEAEKEPESDEESGVSNQPPDKNGTKP